MSFIDLLLLPLFPRYNQKKIIEKEIDDKSKFIKRFQRKKYS